MDEIALRAHVRLLLENTHDFYEMTYEARGAFPLTLAQLVADEAQGHSLLRSQAQNFSRQLNVRAKEKPAWDSDLPLPHPLDADWRFSWQSARQILQHVCRPLTRGDTILLVATPTLARLASHLRLPFKFVFVGRGFDPVAQRLRKLCPELTVLDINDDPASIAASASIIDPPWYDDVAIPMIRKTIRGTCFSGQVYTCVPDVFTACSSAAILADKRALASVLSTAVSIEPLLVRYETPFFELNSLHAARLTYVHPQWRTAQLLRFTAVPTKDADIPSEPSWREFSINTSRIRVREKACVHQEFSSLPVLECVSRARWNQIAPSVVTSGNRFSAARLEMPSSGELPVGLEARLSLLAARENRELASAILPSPLRLHSSVDNPRNVVQF